MIQQGISRRTRLTPEQRKKQLLDVAVQVSASRGLGKAGHSDIAQKTGVAVATVFHYFKTKDVLIVEIVREVESQLMDSVRAIDQIDHKNAYEKIYDHVDVFLKIKQEKPELIKVFLEWSTAIRSDVWQDYLECQKKIMTSLEETIEEGQLKGEITTEVEVKQAVKMLFSVLLWSLLMSHDHRSELNLSEYVKISIGSLIQKKTPLVALASNQTLTV